jgi:pimeloyl-ACP methyl ester carboxylesterase
MTAATELSAPLERAFWTEIDGAKMHAVVVGAGPPVVLLHGYGVSGTYMLPLARVLGSSFCTFVPDLPGQGKSEQLRGGTSMRELADALGAWIEANGLARPIVVANSMGCQVVTELAAQRPSRVGPMVLIGPTVDPARRGAPHQLFGALRDSVREPLSLVAVAARDNAGVGIRALLSTARIVLADRIEDRLPSIEQPTVVVHGGADGFIGRDWAERVTALLPNGRLVIVAGAPHAAHYTHPDVIARIVSELLIEAEDHAPDELRWHLEQQCASRGKAHERRVAQQRLRTPGRDEVVAVAKYT